IIDFIELSHSCESSRRARRPTAAPKKVSPSNTVRARQPRDFPAKSLRDLFSRDPPFCPAKSPPIVPNGTPRRPFYPQKVHSFLTFFPDPRPARGPGPPPAPRPPPPFQSSPHPDGASRGLA